MSSQKAREAFELSQGTGRGPREVRHEPLRAELPAGAALIEAGVRFVTVNMFETVFDEITWDIHGSKPFSPISCYRDLVGPMFDNAYSLAARRSGRARPAAQHDGRGDGRVRPHAEDQPRRRPRPLAAVLDASSMGGGRSRADRSSAPPTRSAARRRTARLRRRRSRRPSIKGSGSTSTWNSGRAGPAHSAGGSRRRADQRAVRMK